MRRDEDRERISVAAPRPTKPERPQHQIRAAAPDAGLVLLVVIVLIAAVGWALGSTAGAQFAGALLGAFVGLVAGFALIYLRYRDL